MLKKLGQVLTTALSYLFSLYIQTLPDILQIILLTVTTFDYSITIQCVATKEKLPKRCLLFPTYLEVQGLRSLIIYHGEKATLPLNFALIFMPIINR